LRISTWLSYLPFFFWNIHAAERRTSATPRHWHSAWNKEVIAGLAAGALLGDSGFIS
jgi:hypothetical protein